MSAHEGRVAIVTGAASGIGAATVDLLLAEGASVVAVDREPIETGRERLATLIGDVTEESVNRDAVALAIAGFGGLDAVVLNAGVTASGEIEDLAMEDFDRAIAVNVRAVALGIRAAAPALRARDGGAIAVTASTSGLAGDPAKWAYNASKAAVINLVRSAALDLGPDGIRVNAVAPGPTITGMTDALTTASDRYEGLRRRTALQRWAQPAEIAAVLAFLVSPAASIVTGAVVPADGGITANTGQFTPREQP